MAHGVASLFVGGQHVSSVFFSSSEVKVGIDELLNVTVSVQNRDNSRVILTYPAEFSFRKFTTLQVRH